MIPDTARETVKSEMIVEEGREEGFTLETKIKSRNGEESPERDQGYENIRITDSHNTGIREEGGSEQSRAELIKSDQMEREKQRREERERELVAGIALHEDGEEELTVNPEDVAERAENEGDTNEEERSEGHKRVEGEEEEGNAEHNELAEREEEDHVAISDLIPLGKESEIEIITQTLIPPSTPPPPPFHHHNAPSSLPVTPAVVPMLLPTHAPSSSLVFPLSFLPSVTLKTVTTNRAFPSLTSNAEGPGQKALEMKISPTLKVSITDKKAEEMKPAPTEQQNTHKTKGTKKMITVIQPKEGGFVTMVQESTPKPKAAKFITKNLKTAANLQNHTPKRKENKSSPKSAELKSNMAELTDTNKTFKSMENDTKFTVEQSKTFPLQPQLTRRTTKTPATEPTQTNKSNKNKKTGKNQTKKPSDEEEEEEEYFPFFKDNYCPPECACYGR